jgi:hypothetical protein
VIDIAMITLTSVAIGAVTSVYLFAGITSWLVAALEMMGQTDNPYLTWLRETSKKNVLLEGLSVAYLTLLWPLHLALKAAFKK